MEYQLRAPPGIWVVQALFTKTILTKRRFAQDVLSRSKTLSHSPKLLAISVFATATTTTLFITPPFERKVSKSLFFFLSKEPSIKGLPHFNEVIIVLVVGDDLAI